MNIKDFSARGVHGYLDFSVAFKPDISYLDGINGSGKTTALKAIVALLMPNLLWLFDTQFSRMQVSVEHNGRTFTIKSVKNASKMSLSVPEAKVSHEFDVAEFQRYQELVADDPALRARARARAGLLPDAFSSNKASDFIRSLPTPMFLGLERTAQSDGALPGSDILLRSSRASGRDTPWSLAAGLRSLPTDTSIEQAAELAGGAYRQVRRARASLTAELRSRLILAAFAKSTTTAGGEDRLPDAKARSAIERTGSSVQQALLQLGIPSEDIAQHVAPFFSELTDILAELPEGRIADNIAKRGDTKSVRAVINWINRRFQMGFIDNLTDAIEKHNANLKTVDEEIDRYTRLVNKFINDSKKSIEFPIEADIPVIRVDKDRTIPLSDLSSGEKQIVVILTHLSFNPSAKNANVLIIDEPEVSLHIHWQEIFVSSLREANPNTQIILATHSPSIILDDKEHSVGL